MEKQYIFFDTIKGCAVFIIVFIIDTPMVFFGLTYLPENKFIQLLFIFSFYAASLWIPFKYESKQRKLNKNNKANL